MLNYSHRPLGITVLGDFILSEGVERVLDKVQHAGATAVACNPTVTAPSAEGQGTFQPPSDAGTSPRLFDRPIFGKRSLWVKSGPSYLPKTEFYRDSPYGPRRTNELTDEYGPIIGQFIDAAIARGLAVSLQLGAVQPSGLRDEDRPRLPDGNIASGRMADTGSLASEPIRAYNRAYIRDLFEQYPGISGFRIDWPEYPCYTFGEIFQDFSPHVERWTAKRGFDFSAIRSGVAQAFDLLQGKLTGGNLVVFTDHVAGPVSLLESYPEINEWLRLKAALSVDTVRAWREAIDEAGGSDKHLTAHAFMSPWALLTGFDFPGAAAHCDAISPKLYTMHWSLMVKFWGEALLAANPSVQETDVVRALVRIMDLVEPGNGGRRLADYGYPLPDEPHPVTAETQTRKIRQVLAAVDGRAAVVPLVHGYGPLDGFSRRLTLVADSEADGVWINRYGYLSDEKLTAIADIW